MDKLTILRDRIFKLRKDVEGCSDLLDRLDSALDSAEAIIDEIAAIKPPGRATLVG